jgi:hypothetical protein
MVTFQVLLNVSVTPRDPRIAVVAKLYGLGEPPGFDKSHRMRTAVRPSE